MDALDAAEGITQRARPRIAGDCALRKDSCEDQLHLPVPDSEGGPVDIEDLMSKDATFYFNPENTNSSAALQMGKETSKSEVLKDRYKSTLREGFFTWCYRRGK